MTSLLGTVAMFDSAFQQKRLRRSLTSEGAAVKGLRRRQHLAGYFIKHDSRSSSKGWLVLRARRYSSTHTFRNGRIGEIRTLHYDWFPSGP